MAYRAPIGGLSPALDATYATHGTSASMSH
jgi:hypothetical protein